jgi:hypothetical protein
MTRCTPDAPVRSSTLVSLSCERVWLALVNQAKMLNVSPIELSAERLGLAAMSAPD